MSPSFTENKHKDDGFQDKSQRSRSKEARGGQTQREKSQDGIFNAKQSIDYSDNNLGDDLNTGLPEHDDEIIRQLNQMTQEIINEDNAAKIFLLSPNEKVEQVECGSIHSLVRTNMNRLFSCGNGATYALGHGNRETCRTFKQI